MVEPVVELRQYTCFGGRRDGLIAVFEREFIASQDVLGAHILGTFTDLDDPDRFVWLRGYADLETRARALPAFYGGPVWADHRAEANVTMLDYRNALLLGRRGPDGGALEPLAASGEGLLGVSIHSLRGVDPELFGGFFEAVMRPRLQAAGAQAITAFATLAVENTFPALPVREEGVFISVARWRDEAAEEVGHARMIADSGWRDSAPEALLPALMIKPERLRLRPTPRSPWRASV